MSSLRILLVALIALFSTHLIASCPTSNTSCSFYTCLEAKNTCGRNAYALGYGLKYCEKFKKNNYKTESAKRWTNDVRKCLQSKLVQFTQKSASCMNIMDSAFNSHPDCYTSAGLCHIARKCFDPLDWSGYCSDLSAIVRTVDISDLMSRRSVKQMKDTLVICVQRGANFGAQQAQKYASWIASHFGDDDAEADRMPDAKGVQRLAASLERLEEERDWINAVEDAELDAY